MKLRKNILVIVVFLGSGLAGSAWGQQQQTASKQLTLTVNPVPSSGGAAPPDHYCAPSADKHFWVDDIAISFQRIGPIADGPVLQTISVCPKTAVMTYPGAITQSFTCTEHWSDNTTPDCANASWTVSPSGIVSMASPNSYTGVATALAVGGRITVRATEGSLTDTASVTVGPPSTGGWSTTSPHASWVRWATTDYHTYYLPKGTHQTNQIQWIAEHFDDVLQGCQSTTYDSRCGASFFTYNPKMRGEAYNLPTYTFSPGAPDYPYGFYGDMLTCYSTGSNCGARAGHNAGYTLEHAHLHKSGCSSANAGTSALTSAVWQAAGTHDSNCISGRCIEALFAAASAVPFVAGQMVNISGVTHDGTSTGAFNGQYAISWVSGNEFTVSQSSYNRGAGETATGGTATTSDCRLAGWMWGDTVYWFNPGDAGYRAYKGDFSKREVEKRNPTHTIAMFDTACTAAMNLACRLGTTEYPAGCGSRDDHTSAWNLATAGLFSAIRSITGQKVSLNCGDLWDADIYNGVAAGITGMEFGNAFAGVYLGLGADPGYVQDVINAYTSRGVEVIYSSNVNTWDAAATFPNFTAGNYTSPAERYGVSITTSCYLVMGPLLWCDLQNIGAVQNHTYAEEWNRINEYNIGTPTEAAAQVIGDGIGGCTNPCVDSAGQKVAIWHRAFTNGTVYMRLQAKNSTISNYSIGYTFSIGSVKTLIRADGTNGTSGSTLTLLPAEGVIVH
jgi:hypothetical protein